MNPFGQISGDGGGGGVVGCGFGFIPIKRCCFVNQISFPVLP